MRIVPFVAMREGKRFSVDTYHSMRMEILQIMFLSYNQAPFLMIKWTPIHLPCIIISRTCCQLIAGIAKIPHILFCAGFLSTILLSSSQTHFALSPRATSISSKSGMEFSPNSPLMRSVANFLTSSGNCISTYCVASSSTDMLGEVIGTV